MSGGLRARPLSSRPREEAADSGEVDQGTEGLQVRAAFKDGLLEAWREEQGAWRVALLDSSFAGGFSPSRTRRRNRLGRGPHRSGRGRSGLPRLPEKARAINRVEGIEEVHSEDTTVLVLAVASEPTADAMCDRLGSSGSANTQLQRTQATGDVVGRGDSAVKRRDVSPTATGRWELWRARSLLSGTCPSRRSVVCRSTRFFRPSFVLLEAEVGRAAGQRAALGREGNVEAMSKGSSGVGGGGKASEWDRSGSQDRLQQDLFSSLSPFFFAAGSGRDASPQWRNPHR